MNSLLGLDMLLLVTRGENLEDKEGYRYFM
ncbi:uncharacterized protein METZ01_LOCUS166042 [marine metagenome]|uniref:Uncharacterized protein n=1 Tax=marine metagenome TaxID=408172 RepID=A0A382BH88_9ZZZZ